MKRLLLFCTALLFVGTGVLAQSVVVRSGEHETFTRLVIKMKDGADWSISRNERLARIDVEQPEIRYDTAEVFSRIPRKRLLGLTQEKKGAPLDLALNCNCEVEGFVHSGRYLVVDIHNPKVPEFRLHSGLRPTALASYRFNMVDNDAHSSLPRAIGRLQTELALPTDPKTPVPTENSTVAVPRLSEQRLLAQIQRAASQGLLTPVVRESPQNTAPVRKEEEPERLPKRRASAATNVEATTVIDRDMSEVAGMFDPVTQKRECLPSALVAISEWGDDRPFADQVSEHRAKLFGEFDHVDTDAATALAKSYVYFGFGLEARAVLTLISEADQQTDALLAMADLLDDQPVDQGTLLAGQSGCSSGPAFWAALAQRASGAEINSDAVLQGFSDLPRHLRRQLGPRLSRQLNSLGQTELAGDILRAVDRSTDTIGPSHDLAAAEFETATGHTKAAVEMMEQVIASDSEFSPEALIQLIDTHSAERRPLRPDLPELAGSYAAEHRLSELGSELRRVHATSLAMVGQFDSAFKALEKNSELDSVNSNRTATNSVLHLLADNADDVTFLTFALPRTNSDENAFTPDLETKLAERLLALGFAEQAYAILDQGKTSSRSESNRLLRAEIALANGLPHRAMIEVLNLTSPEASQIRALAMRANGDFETAGQVLLDAERPEFAARNLWLGDAWDRLPQTEDPRYRRLAEVSSQLAMPIDADDAAPQLSGARTLLEDSITTRSGIDEILGTLQVVNPVQ